MAYCYECGSDNPQNARSCTKCGRPIEGQGVVQQPQVQHYLPSLPLANFFSYAPMKKKRIPTWIIIGVICGILAIVLFATIVRPGQPTSFSPTIPPMADFDIISYNYSNVLGPTDIDLTIKNTGTLAGTANINCRDSRRFDDLQWFWIHNLGP